MASASVVELGVGLGQQILETIDVSRSGHPICASVKQRNKVICAGTKERPESQPALETLDPAVTCAAGTRTG